MFANMAPLMSHSFKNESSKPAKMLIMIAPAGLETCSWNAAFYSLTVDVRSTAESRGDRSASQERTEIRGRDPAAEYLRVPAAAFNKSANHLYVVVSDTCAQK